MLRTARMIVGLRPDKYLRIVAAARHEGFTNTVGIALSARRCPDRQTLIDELGMPPPIESLRMCSCSTRRSPGPPSGTSWFANDPT